VSLNRWVFKWRLKVRMFSHSRMSAGKEFQVDGAATKKARRASSVCMRGTTSIGASEERRARGGDAMDGRTDGRTKPTLNASFPMGGTPVSMLLRDNLISTHLYLFRAAIRQENLLDRTEPRMMPLPVQTSLAQRRRSKDRAQSELSSKVHNTLTAAPLPTTKLR